MRQFVVGVDQRFYVPAEDIQTIFDCHCQEEEFDVIKIPRENLPDFRPRDLGGFLDSRYAYSRRLFTRYPARYCVITTSTMVRTRDRVRVVHFAVASDPAGRLRNYSVLNPDISEAPGEALENLALLVLIRLTKRY